MTRAGEVYRAKATHGFRLLRVMQVRSLDRAAYALCVEVLPSGKKARGALRGGVERHLPVKVALTWKDAAWQMPIWYQLIKIDEAKENT